MDTECSQQIKVLVVDQNPEFFQLIKEQIELSSIFFKITVKHIDQITAAAESLSSWNPNLVVLDFANSPLQAASLVKGCHHLEVPVVITGEVLNKEVEAAAKKIGASAYIVKSEDSEDIEKVLELFSETAKETYSVH